MSQTNLLIFLKTKILHVRVRVKRCTIKAISGTFFSMTSTVRTQNFLRATNFLVSSNFRALISISEQLKINKLEATIKIKQTHQGTEDGRNYGNLMS